MIFDRNGKKEVVALLGAGSMSTAIVRRIAAGRTILLEPGRYDLSEWIDRTWETQGEAWNASHPYVRLQECYDGVEAVFTGLDGLALAARSGGSADVELTVLPRYASRTAPGSR